MTYQEAKRLKQRFIEREPMIHAIMCPEVVARDLEAHDRHIQKTLNRELSDTNHAWHDFFR